MARSGFTMNQPRLGSSVQFFYLLLQAASKFSTTLPRSFFPCHAQLPYTSSSSFAQQRTNVNQLSDLCNNPTPPPVEKI